MKPKLILFDLGRVLADLGSPTAQMRLPTSDDEFWALWLSLPIVQSFERGDICPDDFLARLASELDITEDPDDFRQRFLDWHPRLYSAVEPLVSSLAPKCKLALLSNTNILHWNLIHNQATVFQHFDCLFLSYEIGYCKPENNAFEFVLDNVSVSSSDILFLDDMEQNIAAANRLGIQAVQVNGIGQVCTALFDVGFDTAAYQRSQAVIFQRP